MAPSAIDVDTPHTDSIKQKTLVGKEPLKSSGSLNRFKSIDITPVIGTEFPEADIVEWINSPDADELLRDLAIKSKPIRPYLRVKSYLSSCQSPNEVLF